MDIWVVLLIEIRGELWSKRLMMGEEFVEIGVLSTLVVWERLEDCNRESFLRALKPYEIWEKKGWGNDCPTFIKREDYNIYIYIYIYIFKIDMKRKRITLTTNFLEYRNYLRIKYLQNIDN